MYKWGHRNRIIFDSSKDHLIIIHPDLGEGATFKLLGCTIDTALRMREAVDSIVAKAKPKIKAILRLRAHYSLEDMLLQYKTHIWGFTEYQNGIICHAAPSTLDALNRLQRWFLHELGISEEEAFIQYNFAPPTLRRDIGLLGLIHKRVLGLAHPAFEELLPWHNEYDGGHTKQVFSHTIECNFQWVLFNRSIFGLVAIYNQMPQEIVDKGTVRGFQSALTNIAREQCENGNQDWQKFYNAHYHLTHIFGLRPN